MRNTEEHLKDGSEVPARGYNSAERLKRQIESYNQAEGTKEAAEIYNCPKCKNKGNIAFNKDGAFFTKSCECLKIRQTIRNLKNSGLGAVDKNTLENYIASQDWQRDILKKAKQFISEPLGNWFFIGGQVGAGKTHIGKAIAYEFIKNGVNVRYMEWKKDVQKLNSLINEPEYVEYFSQFTTPAVLYIDDFLKTSKGTAPTQGEVNRAIDIIYQRYNQTNAAVIISSEQPIFKLCEIDEGMGSRIIEKCGSYSVSIERDPEKNFRTHQGQQIK